MNLPRDAIILRKDSSELLLLYENTKIAIKKRLDEFRQLGERGNRKRIFDEMAFCLLTPQSKAKNAWNSILKMRERGVLYNGTSDEIREYIKGVRFNKKKSEYIVNLRRIYFSGEGFFKKIVKSKDLFELRNWLVKSVKGFGLKEASHFLRNIGRGKFFAILDRHILKNLFHYRIINEIPSSISEKKYYEYEKKMKEFSEMLGIPLEELDLLLWYKETGEVFK